MNVKTEAVETIVEELVNGGARQMRGVKRRVDVVKRKMKEER